MENKNFYENITIFKIEYVCVYVYLNYNKKWFNHLFKFGNNKNYNMSTKISNNLLKSTNRWGEGVLLKNCEGIKKITRSTRIWLNVRVFIFLLWEHFCHFKTVICIYISMNVLKLKNLTINLCPKMSLIRMHVRNFYHAGFLSEILYEH